MEISRTKPHRIDIMMDMSGLLPLLNDFSHVRKESNSNLHINLSNVRKVDSIGLAILLGLIFLGKKPPGEYGVELISSNLNYVNNRLHQLGIVELLDALHLKNKKSRSTIDLFDTSPISSSHISYEQESSDTPFLDGLQKVILFNPRRDTNRQDALDSFSRALKEFMACDAPRTFNHEQIIKVFIELAKNTFDHSFGFGVAGLRLNSDSRNKTIQFVYCDTGEGICRNVRRHAALNLMAGATAMREVEKGSAMDFLYRALQPGFSTRRGNGINHGMGLTLITQGAIGCGFNLLLRDAESIIDLSGLKEPYSHSKMRAKSSRSTAPGLLMFHFERELPSDRTNAK